MALPENDRQINADLKLHFLNSPDKHSIIKLKMDSNSEYFSDFVCFSTELKPGTLELNLSTSSTTYNNLKLSFVILQNSELSIWTHAASLKRQIPSEYYCCICCTDFLSLDELILHFQNEHIAARGDPTERTSDTCDICDYHYGNTEEDSADKTISSREKVMDQLEVTNEQHILKKNFTCDICKKDFTRKASLLEHLQRHKGAKDKECLICNKKFYSTSFWRHMSTVHPQDNKLSFKCSSCPKTFAQAYKLKIHEKTHLLYEERPFLCEKCPGKRYSSIYRLKSHIKNIHGDEFVTHICSDCGINFSSSSTLLDHQNSTHKTSQSVQNLNKKLFINPTSHKETSRFVKGVMDTGSFEINNTEILSKDANNIPMTLPTQEEEKSFMHTDKKIQCNYCDRLFKTDKAKRSHLRNVHLKDKPFDCSVCGVKFSSLSYLKDHKKNHSEIKNFDCDVCHKKFRASKDLTRHYRTHTGDKPYKCNDCDKRFGSPSNLSEHRTLHTGRLPYSCGICKIKFRLWSSLNYHKLKVHARENSNVLMPKENISDFIPKPFYL
ncbi:zinc finger Y-chromosomal protein [Lepeophtheirus salmonis]|uniref:zinc finger Y-chromosomal protein n=1 Tax=Lepeophtheirus salmonis TaxID=72036 RepID=UPI001AE99108|nr:zinc finger protein 2 homolog [Lepeophtheirus salmonis]